MQQAYPQQEQKKKEQIKKEQQKLKQQQLPLKRTPPPKHIAKEKQVAPGQPPTSGSTELVPTTKKSLGPAHIPWPPTPKQSLLTSVQSFEASGGWEPLPMQTPSGNSFG